MTLCMNQGAAATATMGMHLWIWMLQIHNADSLTTILYISRTNVQHAIFVVRKVILHVIVTLKRKTIILQDLHSPSINHNHHCLLVSGPKATIRSSWPIGPHWGHNNNISTSDHWHESSPLQHLRPPPQYTCPPPTGPLWGPPPSYSGPKN